MKRRGLILMMALLAGGGSEGTDASAAQGAAATSPQAPHLHGAKALRADFAFLYEGLKRAHFNLYENVSKESYDRLFDQMMAEIDRPESTADAARRFQRFAAFGRIAHARIDSAHEDYRAFRAAGGRIFPLLLRFRERRAFVLENRSGVPAPPEGAELLTIDGEAVGAWYDRVRGSVSADTDYLAGSLLEFYFSRLLWREAGPRRAFGVSYLEDGEIKEAVLPARTAEEMEALKRSDLLRLDPDTRESRMVDGGVAYLRPGPFYNNSPGAADMYDNRAYRRFIDEAMSGFIREGARALIIDLRENPGGDNSFSDPLIAWFATRPFRFASDFQIRVSPETIASNAARLGSSIAPEASVSARMAALYARSKNAVVSFPVDQGRPRDGARFRGAVYLLVDRHSYSNAVATAALVQDYRFGTIVGEETSDLATTLGAMETFQLPNTKISVGYPKAQIIRPNGSRLRRGVVPDIPIETPRVQDRSDPVLRQAVAIAAQRIKAKR
jgi:hypothetical protein